jgi:hypothetical protein
MMVVGDGVAVAVTPVTVAGGGAVVGGGTMGNDDFVFDGVVRFL